MKKNIVQPRSVKQPYLTAQCKLMTDYTNPRSLSTTTTYHSVLSVWDANGNRMPNATLYLKADRNCSVYVSSGASFAAQAINTTPRQFTTNSSGEFDFSYAAGDSLTAPMFSVQTGFMASDEYLLMFPDRQAHHRLATMTGDQLLNSQPTSSLTTKLKQNSVDIRVANSLSSAVNNFMASAVEHDVQADYPLLWLVDEPAENVFKPVPRLYQNTSSARVAYNPKSDVASMHYTKSDDATLQRIVSGAAMPQKNWQYVDNHYSALSASEAQAKRQNSKQSAVYLNLAAAVNQEMIDSGKTSFTRAEVAEIVQKHRALGVHLYSLSDLWNDIKNATSVVVSVVEHVIEDVQQALHVVSIWLDNAKNYVLQTVDDAVNAIGGLFAKFAVVTTDIIDFFKSAFDWNDILETQGVLQQYLKNMVPTIKAQVGFLESKILTGLDTIQSTVDSYLDQAIGALSTETLGDAQLRVTSSDPQDIQSSYILRNTTTYMTDGSSSLSVLMMGSSGQSTISRVFEQLIQNVSADVDQFKTLIAVTPSFTTLFSDPQAFLKAGVADIISAVKLLWDVAMDLLKAGIAGVFEVFTSILNAIDQLMKTRIVIPFITDLYEHVIHPGGQLTGYDLLALFGAAPLTIAYKWTHNGELPFGSDSRATQSFLNLPASSYPAFFTDADTSNEFILDGITWGLGYISGGAILLWGAISSVKDLGGSESSVLESIAVVLEFAVLACHAPIGLTVDTSDVALFHAAVWGTTAIPFILDAAELFTPKPLGAYIWSSATTWNLLIKPGINVALGVIHTLAFIASGTCETVEIAESGEESTTIAVEKAQVWLETAIDIVSVIPELDKVLLFSGEFAELIPVIDAASLATWGLGTWSVTSADLALDLA